MNLLLRRGERDKQNLKLIFSKSQVHFLFFCFRPSPKLHTQNWGNFTVKWYLVELRVIIAFYLDFIPKTEEILWLNDNS